MGTWGTGIKSNDTFADVYEEFFEMYNKGLSIEKITQKLIKSNKDLVNSNEYSHDFWFCLAFSQWECGELSEDVFKKVENIIVSGKNIEVWKALDATPKDLRAKEKVLNKFLTQLKNPKQKTKKRKSIKIKLLDSLFQIGDCLVYKMDNNNFGGAYVLTEEKQTEAGENYIVITKINTKKKPTLDDFRKAELFVINMQDLILANFGVNEIAKDEPLIAFFSAYYHTKGIIDIEVIGNLIPKQPYVLKNDLRLGYTWGALKDLLFKIGDAKTKIYLKEWIE